MLFSEAFFLVVFMPLVIGGHFFMRKISLEAGKTWLLIASSLFCWYWDFSALVLLLGSILLNYSVGQKLLLRQSKWLLSAGIALNLLNLAYFKYANFFLSSLAEVSGNSYSTMNIILPLAISFYTFQQIAYLVDCHRQEAKKTSLLDYSLFVSFFPQLIAGPIVHHKQMIGQFDRYIPKGKRRQMFHQGMVFFTLGLFKKLVIADSLAIPVNAAFNMDSSLIGVLDAWCMTLGYTLQLYFDFSGYCDMAIGLGLMLGICLPNNFNSPLKATSIKDFWSRWHITLSQWLGQYLYIPLGGNKKGPVRTFINVMITFLLGGLWHGAAMTFVIWGALHGLALSIEKIFRALKLSLPKALASGATFLFVMLTFAIFRANDLDQAKSIFLALVGQGHHAYPEFIVNIINVVTGDNSGIAVNYRSAIDSPDIFLSLASALILARLAPNTVKWVQTLYPYGLNKKDRNKQAFFGIFLGFIFAVCVTLAIAVPSSEFIYFNF